MGKIKSLCVYCGASFNGNESLLKCLKELARIMVDNKIELVYGGGSVGVMGIIADEVLALGGKAVGVIPQFLLDKEVGHKGLTALVVTENMHQRKQQMADLADAFLILPGGFGTMEEFFEVLTWLQLGLHNKSIGVLNFEGFYDHLLAQLDVMVNQGFLKQTNRELVLSHHQPIALINAMLAFKGITDDKWFEERNLS